MSVKRKIFVCVYVFERQQLVKLRDYFSCKLLDVLISNYFNILQLVFLLGNVYS